MKLLTAIVCAIASTLASAAPVTDLDGTALTLRHYDPSTSAVIVCTPGANGHCDQQVHIIPQINGTAAKDALARYNAYDQKHGNHHSLAASINYFPPKTATIMVCSGSYYTSTCDHPTITDGVCKQMTVGSLVNGPPQAGGAPGMSSMWVGDKINHCILSCGLDCEDINRVGGFENWGNIEDMSIDLLKPLDNMILSYKCSME